MDYTASANVSTTEMSTTKVVDDGPAGNGIETVPMGFPMNGYVKYDASTGVDTGEAVRRTFAAGEVCLNSGEHVSENDDGVRGEILFHELKENDVAECSPSRDGDDTVKVVVRVRPPLERELSGHTPYSQAFAIESSERSDSLTLSENLNSIASGGVENGIIYNTYRFGFDRVYSPEAKQEQVYCESARDVVMNVLQGYNASIIAYGQTGAGKTHTMTGSLTGEYRGIIPRAVDDVFDHISHDCGTTVGDPVNYLVRASYLQIYNEVISDLLKPENKNLTVREDSKRGVFVEGLSEWVVRNPSDVYDLMSRGSEARMKGATRLNELSSRSHAIFILVVEKSYIVESGGDGGGSHRTVRMGKLNLVDLAGSERVHVTGARGARLEESKKINQSLSALGNVIGALTDPKRQQVKGAHIPYRDSKLTRILEDSLGGNCKTTFVAVISPAVEAFSESLSTLKFANRAKRVKNAPRVNEDENHRTLLKKYERELKRLRAELQARGKDLVDRRLVLQLEEARRKEQADKIAAMSALERQSAEIARQKAAMASLQKRISSMQSQLLTGGQSMQDTPAFRNLLAREQNRIREEYEKRLLELESERRLVAEDKAATERLKGLLLKQRDVMVALTKRLGERDKEVIELQSSLDATEKKLKETEDALDKRTAQLISIRKRMAAFSATKEDSTQTVDDGVEIDRGDEDPMSLAPEDLQSDCVETTEGPLEVTMELCCKTSQDGLEEDSGDIENRDPEEQESKMDQKEESFGDMEGPTLEQQQDNNASGNMYHSKNNVWESEREALKTILELKVLSLLGDVEGSISNLSGDGSNKERVLRQLGYLKKLVSATVTAMELPPE